MNSDAVQMQSQMEIFGPLFAMLLLTFVVWTYMYCRRIPFLNSLNLEADEITPAKIMRLSPPEVSNPSDNLRNLFEIPVLFYAFALFLFVTGQVDTIYLVGSWAFVAFRVLHSGVHCTFNKVLLRFALYVISTFILWAMMLRAGVQFVAAIAGV